MKILAPDAPGVLPDWMMFDIEDVKHTSRELASLRRCVDSIELCVTELSERLQRQSDELTHLRRRGAQIR